MHELLLKKIIDRCRDYSDQPSDSKLATTPNARGWTDMTVYVDDMYKYPMGQFGRMKMSHMVADTVEELLEMADKIGVARKWIQHAEKGKGWVHFDISISARRRAIAAGAKQITLRELALMTMEWKKDTVAARVENGTR